MSPNELDKKKPIKELVDNAIRKMLLTVLYVITNINGQNREKNIQEEEKLRNALEEQNKIIRFVLTVSIITLMFSMIVDN